MKFLSSILLLLLALAAPLTAAEASMKAVLDSSYLIKGEQTRLTLYLQSDVRPTTRPGIPVSDHVSIQFLQERPGVLPNRQRVYVYTYNIRSFQEGAHTIPGFSIQLGGTLIESVPLPIHVHPLEVLTWHTQANLGPTFRYASAVFVPEKSPYVGQTFPAEVKVYLPDSTGGSTNGVADLDHDGLVAWRFESTRANTRVQLPTGGHTATIFQSTASPIRSGAISLGGGKARIMIRVRRTERGFSIVQDVPAEFELPKTTLQARPLPAGAPSGFAGAVGSFLLNVTAEIQELEEGDPIAVRLNVTGTGNLDSLPPPRLDAPEDDWKIYEASRLERQGERRDVTGSVSFSQIIRPLNVQDQVPSFDLVYFNPATSTYATSRSRPIPFKTKPSPHAVGSAAIIPTLTTPVEDMQGILAVIDPRRSQHGVSDASPLNFWQLVPALLAAALLFRIAQRYLFPRFKVSERERQIRGSLAEVAGAGDNEGQFLRAAGAFVERWIPTKQRQGDLADLLERRDTDCFRPDHAERLIESQEKQSLLKTLKEHALSTLSTLILFLALSISAPGTAQADETDSYDTAESAYLSGNYRTALEIYRSEPTPHSADLLYNIGNCHYQLNAPGQAVFFYHRALLLDPGHPEALQNLRFLERSQGSISIVRRPYEDTLAALPRSVYRTLATAGAWIAGLSILALFALTGGTKVLSSIALSFGLFLGTVGVTCIALYPNDAEFAPSTERAVTINAARIKGRTEASETGPKAIDIPPGSVCRVLAPRGSWTYVEFPNRTRAWVPSDQVSLLQSPETELTEHL